MRRPSCSRRALAYLGFFILLLAATPLLLSTIGIIPIKSNLSNGLLIFFSILGTIFAFGQWLVPFTPSEPVEVKLAPKKPDIVPVPRHQGYDFRIEIDNDLKFSSNGALIVFANELLLGKAVKLHFHTKSSFYQEYYTAYIERKVIGKAYFYAAVFPKLTEGYYTVSIPYLGDRDISIFSSKTIEMDIRAESIVAYSRYHGIKN